MPYPYLATIKMFYKPTLTQTNSPDIIFKHPTTLHINSIPIPHRRNHRNRLTKFVDHST